MKTFDNAQDKIQQICDQLKKETLEPAKLEAARLIEEAEAKAKIIIADGEKEKSRLIHEGKKEVEKEKNVFKSSLLQASNQSLEALRQAIVKDFFNDELEKELQAEARKPDIIANLISAVINALEKGGINTKLEAIIPKSISGKDVALHLADAALKKLEGEPEPIGGFNGGAKVKLVGKQMTIDITDKALRELVSSYAPKDFRDLIFQKDEE